MKENEIAEKYIRGLYIDYGDLNDKAEKQIKDAVIFGLNQCSLCSVSQQRELLMREIEKYHNWYTGDNNGKDYAKEYLDSIKWYNNNEIIKPTSFVLTDDIEMFLNKAYDKGYNDGANAAATDISNSL